MSRYTRAGRLTRRSVERILAVIDRHWWTDAEPSDSVLDLDAMLDAIMRRGPRIAVPHMIDTDQDGQQTIAVTLSREPEEHEQQIVGLALLEFADAHGIEIKRSGYIRTPQSPHGAN